MILFFFVCCIFLFVSACEKFNFWKNHGADNAEDDAQVTVDWYKLQIRILLERNSALNGVYFAYIGIGLYEAVQPGIENAVSLSSRLYQMPAMPSIEPNKKYNWQVSANAALASMIKSYYTGLTPANLASIDSLENAYNEKLRPVSGDSSFIRSQLFGKSIASAVYNWSLTDQFNPSNQGYIPAVFPGSWVPTPPAFANAVQPYIGSARPLLTTELNSVAPLFPESYSENANSGFYKIVKEVYDVSKTLTTEQKNIALFWVDQGNGVGVTTSGHDFSLVTQAIVQTHAGLFIAAEVYAKTGIAERESAIICFRSKYTYNLVRPVTYIRKFIDPQWLPFIVTPPHPEYPAAHAFVTGSVMEAASQVLGDDVKITDHTYDFRSWTPRTFSNLFKAGEEAGISRLYGGIHYLPSINTGLSLAKDLGKKIGKIKLHG